MDEKRDLEAAANAPQQYGSTSGQGQLDQVGQPPVETSLPPPYSGSIDTKAPFPQDYPVGYGVPPVNTQYGPPPPVQPQTTYVTQTTTNYSSFDDLKGAIPIMPMWLAVTCFCINCVLPGFGTITASFSVFCCAQTQGKKADSFGTFCLNFWIGCLQFLTLWIFLIGWIWSIMWGWAFIAYSIEYYGRDVNEQRVVTTTTRTTNMVPVQPMYAPNTVTTTTRTTTINPDY